MAMEHGQISGGSLESLCPKIHQSSKKNHMFVSMLIVKKGKKDTVNIVVNIRPLGKLLLEESLGKKRLKRLLQEIIPTMSKR